MSEPEGSALHHGEAIVREVAGRMGILPTEYLREAVGEALKLLGETDDNSSYVHIGEALLGRE